MRKRARSYTQTTELFPAGDVPALIKEIRRAKMLTQIELAFAVGVNNLAISRWERGENVPSVKNLRMLLSLRDSIPPNKRDEPVQKEA